VTASTKPIVAYDEAELARLLLHMCPKSWQDQYDLNQEALPTGVRKLLVVLENIEKIVVNSNAKDKTAKENTEKATGKCKKGKSKGSSSNDYHIPKKVRFEIAACCARNMGVLTQPTILLSAISTRKMGLLSRFSVERQPLDRNTMAIIRKKMPILCIVHGLFLETRDDCEEGPEKLMQEEMSPQIQ
jgi:hypothetical protein